MIAEQQWSDSGATAEAIAGSKAAEQQQKDSRGTADRHQSDNRAIAVQQRSDSGVTAEQQWSNISGSNWMMSQVD